MPPLSRSLDVPLLLLEAEDGAVGMAELIRRAAAEFGTDELVVVDVGGDIIAEGHETARADPHRAPGRPRRRSFEQLVLTHHEQPLGLRHTGLGRQGIPRST
ncbi:DUF1152 domain-containing protein [Nocardia niigatensis]|uniref:DUF1152 domain-containing protein n=1 Tax=Nocardia niigatensis TaxID=209249 RepID=UPI003570F8F0